ncbi:MAG: 2,3,4,5-tetrahydropyridine-2,6-dicarboxylate N-succinyltransferase [Candidatus Bipolaricaulota bacterium]|nr:2,3,4,5-tetrahydropyridine-2,6-dicarboxylate N-succinyltransferase [Candidatus Bipolaricaulota bacterium]MCS7274488.1 2,3,4,5-tetrahydropyridine-2,6-dicarboxylate N-succinyltransferase [Candidatus Bipolaricaulota bacterium]MDW8111115.1 2,3,4,5-tetrahydropyridine-2,6-dicarboxylate N-succinyltransferase [Candidatus Bipolaricaulota bacterium]MDW8329055.1 2,3,4,5-tetrahydropyridine-2,6-dicarboxylate N-succinyltransferase [Candidatus Bipolaricaulota bacterium]
MARDIASEIERLARLPSEALGPEARTVFEEFKRRLTAGEIRAAEKVGEDWLVHSWVKQGILLGFRLGQLTDFSLNEQFRFFDKETYPLQRLSLERRVRVVPGGTAIRDGAYVAPGVVIMPPSYINVGAYIDAGTMIDSHVLVGSCAQVGKRVHLSAAAQVGGVLEPVGARPVIIEDDVFIGGNCGIYEGTLIRRRAVIGAGVILTASVPVYDIVHQRVYRGTRERPLVIPEGAVVVPGARALSGGFAQAHGLALYAPVIVKYRDEKTDAGTVLEEALR